MFTAINVRVLPDLTLTRDNIQHRHSMLLRPAPIMDRLLALHIPVFEEDGVDSLRTTHSMGKLPGGSIPID